MKKLKKLKEFSQEFKLSDTSLGLISGGESFTQCSEETCGENCWDMSHHTEFDSGRTTDTMTITQMDC